MSTTYEPKITLPNGAVSPDTYDPANGGEPPGDFVVSRHRNGTPASFYRELAWNMTAYHPRRKRSWFYFAFWKDREMNKARFALCREAVWIIFALGWLRQGPTYAVNNLRLYTYVSRALALHADKSGCRIRDVLGDEARLMRFVETMATGFYDTFASMLSALMSVGADRLGFQVDGQKVSEELRIKTKEIRDSLKQRPPMPTRIYSAVLANLAEELNQWEAIGDTVLPLAAACAQDPMFGRSKSNQHKVAHELGLARDFRPKFDEIAPVDVKAYLVAKEKSLDVKGVGSALLEIQMVAKLTVQAYTGMRDDEAMALPYHCLKTTTSNGRKHYIIEGQTTKFNDGRIKRTPWVTNQEGYRAVQIAQRIADTIYAVCGVKPEKNRERGSDYPLFVAPRYLGFSASDSSHKDGFQTGTLEWFTFKTLVSRIIPLIEEADLKELEKIDPFRAWRKEMPRVKDENGETKETLVFEIGKPWPLVTHQFRRSLALYAQRSGLVSLPSLRRQLQHLTEEMTQYYARGSEFARNFIGDDEEHFGLEWQETQPESECLSYLLNAVLSDDRLFGGHVHWLKHQPKGPDGVILMDRKETMRRFEKGEIAYRETLIGGCTKVGECNLPAMQFLNIECIGNGCRYMVGNLKKLERVIAAQDKLVSALDPGSVEYRTEKNDLEVLIAARDQVVQEQETRK